MAEEELYGELPADGELEGEMEGGDQEQTTQEISDAQAELEAMKARLKQMEEEAAKLREVQDKVQKEAGLAPGESADPADREEADARSVYIGSVDYGCTPEELQLHFQSCGTVNRVTILTDKLGNPKGFAYLEFLEVDAVQNALLLDGSDLRGRQLKVLPKRTNVPGMKQFRGRGRGRGFMPRGRGRGRGFFGGYDAYGGGYGGYPPRGRGRGRGYYSPY